MTFFTWFAFLNAVVFTVMAVQRQTREDFFLALVVIVVAGFNLYLDKKERNEADTVRETSR